jgi:hypothetical protein
LLLTGWHFTSEKSKIEEKKDRVDDALHATVQLKKELLQEVLLLRTKNV